MDKILKGLKNKCVTFKLVSGDQVTGFVKHFEDDIVTLFVSGRTVYLVERNIERFEEAEDVAC